MTWKRHSYMIEARAGGGENNVVTLKKTTSNEKSLAGKDQGLDIYTYLLEYLPCLRLAIHHETLRAVAMKQIGSWRHETQTPLRLTNPPSHNAAESEVNFAKNCCGP